MKWDAIVLAAGDGTRMRSNTPKVLHKVGGQEMIIRVIEALNQSGANQIHLVVSDKIKPLILPYIEKYKNLKLHIQKQPLGTADAVKSVTGNLSEYIFICNGDHPLMNPKDIMSFVDHAQSHSSDLTLGVLNLKSPGSFGRVITNSSGQALEIVEAKHCDEEQFKIKTVNSGIYFCRSRCLKEFFNEKTKEQNKEFYLTDIVKFLNESDFKVSVLKTTKLMGFGVNEPSTLSLANQMAFDLLNQDLMQKGVQFINSQSTYIEAGNDIQPDVLIYPNVYIFGRCHIASGTVIESGVHIKDSVIGPNTYIKAGTYIEGAHVHGDSVIGPYAHLRQGTEIHKNVKVGNFAEIKNSILRDSVKAGHQCYIGDSDIGESTNIGAGTITCNFAVDGKKYKTVIGKNVFVGSDTQIVPPVTIGDYAVLAAGSTVTKDVDAESLYVTRAKAFVKSNYRKKEER